MELVAGKQNRIGVVNPNHIAAVKPHNGLSGEWQQVRVIARGNTLVHVLNGQVITATIDDDPGSRALQGSCRYSSKAAARFWASAISMCGI